MAILFFLILLLLLAICSYVIFKALKWILSIITFKEDKIDEVDFKDEFYTGLNGNKTELRVFYTKKTQLLLTKKS